MAKSPKRYSQKMYLFVIYGFFILVLLGILLYFYLCSLQKQYYSRSNKGLRESLYFPV